MNGSNLFWRVINAGGPMFIIATVIVLVIINHLNTTNGGTEWLGLGTLIALGTVLSIIGFVALIFFLSIRNALRNNKPKPQTNAQNTVPATPATPATPAPKKGKGLWYWMKAALTWTIILGMLALANALLKHWATGDPINWPWSNSIVSPSAPQPQGLCESAFADDDREIYNLSQTQFNRIGIVPGSTTKLCYGSLVSIPEDRWKTWGAQFVQPVGQKEVCVAYFGYIYPDHSVRVIGPLYGPKLDLSDMPNLWRIATNCQIDYYRWESASFPISPTG